MNRAIDNQAPVNGFQVPTDGTAENDMPVSEQGEYCDLFDAPLGGDYVSASPAPEMALAPCVEDASVTDPEGVETEEIHNETDVDSDASLYGAEGYDAEGWKSVNFHIDDGDADRISQGNDDGGDGSMPPPTGPDTPSSDDDQEPEHPRSTPGAPSTGLIKLKSEHSEDSEHSETFSSTDFEDPDWISPIYPEALWVFPPDIGDPYCEEFSKGTVNITALNAVYFARLVILWANLHLHQGNWYAYSESSGTWYRLRKAELLNIIQRCIMRWNERFNIVKIVKLSSTRFRKEVIENMLPFRDYVDIFDHTPKNVINVKNGTIVVGEDGSVVLHDHSPQFLCRNVIDIDYDLTADYSEFVRRVFRDVVTPEDQKIIQLYAGQCALGWNMSQTILIICGEAGTGKSVIVKVVEKVLGRRNYEGLRTKMLDQRFELSRFEGKSLLVASDQCSDTLMTEGAHMLKSLTGDDDLTTERKGENEHSMITGEFNIVIVSNSDLPLSIDGDSGAWRRRIRPVVYSGELPKTLIRRFPNLLLRKYPEQILCWMVEGAAALRRSGDSIDPHPEMLSRIDELIQDSDACLTFVKNYVVHTGNTEDVLFSFALYNAFTGSSYFVGSGSKQVIQTKLKKAMMDVYGVDSRHDLKDPENPKKVKYGYVGYRLEWNEPK